MFLLGVEGLEDIRAMRGLRFRGLQGHWLCPPMPATDLPDATKAGLRRLSTAALPLEGLSA